MLLFNVIAIQFNAPAPKVYDSTNLHFEEHSIKLLEPLLQQRGTASRINVPLKDYSLKKIPLFRLTSFGTPQILYGGWNKTSHTIPMDPLFSQFGRVWDNVAGQQDDTLTQTSPPLSHSSVPLRYTSLAAHALCSPENSCMQFLRWVLNFEFLQGRWQRMFPGHGTNLSSFWLSSVLDSPATFIQ